MSQISSQYDNLSSSMTLSSKITPIFSTSSMSLSFFDSIPDGTIKELDEISINRNEIVPQSLIDEANLIYEESGVIQCIYDLSDRIALNKYRSDEQRDIKLNVLLDGRFYINSWYELSEMPSRLTYYDTVTKHTDLFERHKNVLEYMNSIGFKIANLLDNGISDQELLWDSYKREIPYCSEFDPGVIIRVKSNLMVEMLVVSDGSNKKYFFFYNPGQIFNILVENSGIEYKRELKIKNILS
jgi:hypothetical protein